MEKELLLAALMAQIIVYECQLKVTKAVYDQASDREKLSIKPSMEIMEYTLEEMRQRFDKEKAKPVTRDA